VSWINARLLRPEKAAGSQGCSCLLLPTSGEVDPGYSPTTRIRLIWISPTIRRVLKVIAELSAAMAALKETAGLVKVISAAKTDSEIKAATFELQSKLLTLQSDCFNLGDVVRSRDEEIMLLKAKIAEFEDFKSQAEGYILHQTDAGSLVYSKQIGVNDSQITVNACPHCFQQKKISILQPGTERSIKGSYWIHFCPSCKSDFKMDKTPAASTPKDIVRRLPGGSGW
jgi:hypothetical protein